jgi:hypothetical protein
MVEAFMVHCEVPMACTGGDELAKHPAGEFVLPGPAFFCMRLDIKGLVGLWCVLYICCVYICIKLLFCFMSEVYWRWGNTWVMYGCP